MPEGEPSQDWEAADYDRPPMPIWFAGVCKTGEGHVEAAAAELVAGAETEDWQQDGCPLWSQQDEDDFFIHKARSSSQKKLG